MLDTGCWILDAGYWILDAGYWMLDAGCWIRDAGCWILTQLSVTFLVGATVIKSSFATGMQVLNKISCYERENCFPIPF